MALRNPKLFGLDVNSIFADVQDKSIALRNLNLPLFDLDVIRGSANAGASRHDWISFSRLKVPIYKNIRRFSDDSSIFVKELNIRAGIEGILFGNLNVNGRFSGNSIRYRYLDFDDNNSVKFADISTSRASAWSSTFSEPVPSHAPISYGAELKTIGNIVFGTQTTSSVHSNVVGEPRLQTTQNAILKEFDSEFPTHKVRASLGGKGVTLYMMKGIPIVFRGFFRNLSAEIGLTSLINDVSASWKIVERDNPSRYVNFKNVGGLESRIDFRSSRGKDRLIQFYYNPDNIRAITITAAALFELPAVKFTNLQTINFSSNRLRNFPDLNFICPSVLSVNLSNNQFYYSETPAERRLTQTVTDKIPQTIIALDVKNSFKGSVDQNIIADRFPVLRLLILAGGRFIPDDNNPTNPMPNVSRTVTSYNVYSSDFRAFGTTDVGNNRYNFQDLPDLESLNISGNYYFTGPVTISSTKIKSINFHNVGLQIPNGLQGSTTLETFVGSYMRNAGSLFTGSGSYRFSNCIALTSLNFSHAGLSGAFPQFSNIALTSLNLHNTKISGGTFDGDTTYVIPENTFSLATNLTSINIRSSNLLTSPIHPNALGNLTKLKEFYYYSFGRTGGNIPNLGNNTNLVSLLIGDNNFSGGLPSLTTTTNIYKVNLSNNNFTGAIPGYKNLSNLRYLYVHNNALTAINQFSNLPALEYFYAHNNDISGTIPSFSGCPRMYYLILFNNNFTDYTSGSFSTLYRIRYIDISGNNLTQGSVDSIIEDLFANYNSVNRGRVTINLRGNAVPGVLAQETILILRSKGWTITTS